MNSNMSGLPMGDNIVLHLHEFRRSGRVWKNRKNVLTTLFRNTSDESIQRVIQHFLPLSDPTSNPHQLRALVETLDAHTQGSEMVSSSTFPGLEHDISFVLMHTGIIMELRDAIKKFVDKPGLQDNEVVYLLLLLDSLSILSQYSPAQYLFIHDLSFIRGLLALTHQKELIGPIVFILRTIVTDFPYMLSLSEIPQFIPLLNMMSIEQPLAACLFSRVISEMTKQRHRSWGNKIHLNAGLEILSFHPDEINNVTITRNRLILFQQGTRFYACMIRLLQEDKYGLLNQCESLHIFYRQLERIGWASNFIDEIRFLILERPEGLQTLEGTDVDHDPEGITFGGEALGRDDLDESDEYPDAYLDTMYSGDSDEMQGEDDEDAADLDEDDDGQSEGAFTWAESEDYGDLNYVIDLGSGDFMFVMDEDEDPPTGTYMNSNASNAVSANRLRNEDTDTDYVERDVNDIGEDGTNYRVFHVIDDGDDGDTDGQDSDVTDDITDDDDDNGDNDDNVDYNYNENHEGAQMLMNQNPDHNESLQILLDDYDSDVEISMEPLVDEVNKLEFALTSSQAPGDTSEPSASHRELDHHQSQNQKGEAEFKEAHAPQDLKTTVEDFDWLDDALNSMRKDAKTIANTQNIQTLLTHVSNWISNISPTSTSGLKFSEYVFSDVDEFVDMLSDFSETVSSDLLQARRRSLQSIILANYALDILNLLDALLSNEDKTVVIPTLVRASSLKALADVFYRIPWGIFMPGGTIELDNLDTETPDFAVKATWSDVIVALCQVYKSVDMRRLFFTAREKHILESIYQSMGLTDSVSLPFINIEDFNNVNDSQGLAFKVLQAYMSEGPERASKHALGSAVQALYRYMSEPGKLLLWPSFIVEHCINLILRQKIPLPEALKKGSCVVTPYGVLSDIVRNSPTMVLKLNEELVTKQRLHPFFNTMFQQPVVSTPFFWAMAATLNNFRVMQSGKLPPVLPSNFTEQSIQHFRSQAFSCKLSLFFRKPKNWVKFIRELLMGVEISTNELQQKFLPCIDAIIGILLICQSIGKLNECLQILSNFPSGEYLFPKLKRCLVLWQNLLEGRREREKFDLCLMSGFDFNEWNLIVQYILSL
eukprot:gene6083-9164_t